MDFPGTYPHAENRMYILRGGHSGAVRLGLREQQPFRRRIRLQRMASMSMTWVCDDPPVQAGDGGILI